MLKKLRVSLSLKNKRFLGIDIGTREIKMVEVGGASYQNIINMNVVPTPPGAVDDGTIMNKEAVAKSLRSLVEQSGTKTRLAVTSISGKNVITRFIRLPKMTDKEVASTLKWEADKYIPLTKEEDQIIEHLILGEITGEENSQINVLIVAVPRRLVFQIYEIFSMAGLVLTALEIEPLSLWRSIGSISSGTKKQNANNEDAFVVLDIGARSSNFVAFQGERLLFSRYMPTGGDAAADIVAQSFGLDLDAVRNIIEEEAEILSEQVRDSASEKMIYMDSRLRTGFSPVVSEVRRSLDFYRSQFERSDPEELILTGGTAKLKGLDGLLQKELGLPVTIGLNQVSVPAKFNKYQFGDMNQLDPSFAVALGLALRGGSMNHNINLLPPELRNSAPSEGGVPTKRFWIYIAAALFIIGYGSFSLWMIYLDKKCEGLDAALMSIEPELKLVESYEKENTSLDKEISGLEEIQKEKISWAAILQDVNNRLPQDIWITDFIFDKSGQVRIEGVAGNISAIGIFLYQLHQMPYFDTFTMKQASEIKVGEVEQTKFSLIGTLAKGSE